MKSQFPDETLARIERCGVVAVLVIDDADDAVPLAKALLDGGVNVMELTLRTAAALDALKNVCRHVPEMLAGIGTILRTEQIQQVSDAGAAFGVAPGLNGHIVRHAQQVGLPFAPGVVTPSDIELAVELGCRELKFFPAQPSGGMQYLTSMAAPYNHLELRYIPLGGINVNNMLDYLAKDIVPAVGGSWIATRSLIAEKNWLAITENASAARSAIDRLRNRSVETS